ncbi:MAG: thiamine pyrophosphate-dependent dehydrogenase E1 component subunit alpha [Chloroflexota bacterium]
MTIDGAVSSPAPLDTPAAMLERMWLIRAFEERASELYAKGRIGGLLHLGIGQEGSAVGVASALAPGDRLFGGHRAHAHALALGADPTALLAELLGRRTGLCGGKGGSMHISAPEVGFVTATGVVAGNIPLALGAALASVTAGEPGVAVAVFGDGAGQAGGFHESLNLASLWGLPVLFLCENNGYAEFSPLSAHTKVERLARHAETYAIPAVTVDGNDAGAVQAAVREAVARARTGGGPSFVEALTYRLRGHYEGDPGKYRELSELADWKAKDPILRFVAAAGLEAETPRLEARARAVVDAATEAALAAPEPTADDLLSDVLAPVPAGAGAA